MQEYLDEESAGLLSGEANRTWWDDLYDTWVLAWPIFGTFILQVREEGALFLTAIA